MTRTADIPLNWTIERRQMANSRPVIDAGHFRTDHLRADLKGCSVRGGIVTFIAQGIKFILQLGSIVVLARLLTPADFGLIAMITAVTGFAAMFKDAGLSVATVQCERLNHEQISTLFWINVSFGVTLTIVTAALAPVIAWFYGEPKLTLVTLVLASTLTLSGVTVQHEALLQRQMRFVALAVIGTASMSVGILVAITAAGSGAGYWGLVLMPTLSAITSTVLVWTLCSWRPGPPRFGTGVRPMLALGGNLTGFNFLNYFARNADNILIGWVWGAGALGLYSRAYSLLMMPIQQFNGPASSVAIPAFSRLQREPEQYRRYYVSAVSLIAMAGMPVVVFAFVAAEDLVYVLFGEHWKELVPIFRALGPAAFVGTFNVATGWVYASLGHTHRQLRWGLFAAPIFIIAFIAGLPWGAVGVAAAASIAYVLLQVPAALYCFRHTPLNLLHLGEALWRPALSAILAGVPGCLIQLSGMVTAWSSPSRIGLVLTLYVLSYSIMLTLLPGGTKIVKEALRVVRST